MYYASALSLLPLSIEIFLTVVFSILSIYIVLKVTKLATRWLYWGVAQSSANTSISLVCFAIATYYFPAPLVFILRQGWNFILHILGSFPSLIQQNANFENVCRSAPAYECLNVVSNGFSASWSAFISNALLVLRLDQYPVTDTLFFVVIWVGLARVLTATDLLSRLATWTPIVLERLHAGYSSISSAGRANALFFFLLVAAAYLSFSAVIAIPSLQEATQQDPAKSDDLKTRLKSVIAERTTFDAAFPELPKLPFDVDKGVPAQTADAPAPVASSDGSGAGQTDRQSSRPNPLIQYYEKDFARRYAAFNSRWNEIRGQFFVDQSNVMERAIEVFDLSNRGRKGVRETEQHFLNIDLWYRRWWADRSAALNTCRASVDKYRSGISQMSDLAEATAMNDSGASSFFTSFSKTLSDYEENAQYNCTISNAADYEIPLREDFGGYLGVFGSASKWLLKTESLSLVLIAGLLGFGLLGAACSTFIRNVPTRNPGDPFVKDLAGVVLRGGSAAVMIFLAVYGGLAVFAGPNTNPNPYVVLFTCLLAAVYSDIAWDWAANELRERLKSQRDDTSAQVVTKTGKTSA